ncbi:hypothetical protein LR004_00615 [Candidatus Gracilibacteria bacterium]|nr:hypothetical protein [Candidatus Gracilibacteria bacterium]
MVWGFYAVARMHTMKFKRFSTHIVPVTNFLLIFLVILSIIGFVLLFFISPEDNNSGTINGPEVSSSEETDEVNYREEIIGNEHY